MKCSSRPLPRSAALTILSIFTLVSLQPAALAQEALTLQWLEGVWKITNVVTEGVANANPQPGLAIFSRGYCSILRVNGDAVRPQSPPANNPANLTDAEKIARYEEWAAFGAVAGTCEVNGNTLLNHNILAKNVAGMTLTEQANIEVIDKDTFVATPKQGEPNSGRRTTYSRIR